MDVDGPDLRCDFDKNSSREYEMPSDDSWGKQGLSTQEAEKERGICGENILARAERDPWWKQFLRKFNDPVIRILMLAAVLSGATGGLVEGLGILLAVVLATGISFLSEYRAGREFDILNQVDDEIPVKTFRDGKLMNLPRRSLVTKDVILLETGEEIPADAEVLEAVNFHVDQSKFTGEPEPVPKMPSSAPGFAELEEATYPHHVLLRGSTVLDGHACARVTAVGPETVMGRTALAASEDSGNQTPLQKQLSSLGRVIAAAGILLSAALFAILFAEALFSGELPLDIGRYSEKELLNTLLGFFMIAVTLIVVAVPEGLAMSVTLSLACSMRRMVASNCLVRKLHACETIGAATVICTDKTGTLTMNRMHVRQFHTPDGKTFSEADFSTDSSAAGLRDSICVNSTANLSGQDEKKDEKDTTQSAGTEVLGNPTEGALLLWVEKNGADYRKIRESEQIVRQWTFSSERKFMATLTEKNFHIKGAPEIVLERCDFYRDSAGNVLPLDREKREAVAASFRQAQSEGSRTLAFACRDPETLHDECDDVCDLAAELTYLGFVSIADPVRREVPAAVASCRNAGIEVKVVTGDTPATACEIGRQIGLWKKDQSSAPTAVNTAGPGAADHPSLLTPGTEEGKGKKVWNGKDFLALEGEEETLQAARELSIIARARPEDKLKLVCALQKQGQVVAVTGDGTNDAPALNHADVGIAMGKSGTAVAREAADIILLDDSFQSIVNAVLWGRSLYLNIQRFLVFQLTINVAAVGIALSGPFLGVSMPLTVIQMLWINLIMDTFAALALATEPPDPELMKRPPRSPDAFIVTAAMARNIFGTAFFYVVLFAGMLLLWQKDDGGISARELSIIFTVFVMLQFWNLFNVRTFGTSESTFGKLRGNRVFTGIAGFIFIMQILIVQFGGNFFRTVPLSPAEWAVIIGGTSCVLWVGELKRLVCRLSGK